MKSVASARGAQSCALERRKNNRFGQREFSNMRMRAIEKYFVNSQGHTLRVGRHTRQLLERIDIQSNWRYLDVGCGVGAGCEVAAGLGLNVTGIDVDPGQIEAARAAYPHIHFIVMDATKLQFNDSEFDIVATSMATHHIPGWDRAFSEMIRVLRPGGYLIYSDFTFPSWLGSVGRYLIPFVGLPSAKLIESLASEADLTRIHHARTGLTSDFIWLRRS
jgi:ubiquinone/menaquinone biosynthesis C-methylase UbiE